MDKSERMTKLVDRLFCQSGEEEIPVRGQTITLVQKPVIRYNRTCPTQLSFAEDIGQNRDEYFKKYTGVQTYIDKTLEEARQRGYVTTLLNRRRYLPDILSPTVAIRQATERMAVNTPLQGTAADVIKVSMIRIQNRIEELGLSARVIMQVHDELVFEVPEEELPKAIPMIQNEMETVMNLSVPLKVSIHTGRNWAEVH